MTGSYCLPDPKRNSLIRRPPESRHAAPQHFVQLPVQQQGAGGAQACKFKQQEFRAAWQLARIGGQALAAVMRNSRAIAEPKMAFVGPDMTL